MADFKVGDEVRVLSDSDHRSEQGEVGTVGFVGQAYVHVQFSEHDPDRNFITVFSPHELELVGVEDVVNHPSHYTAYGAEVIDITEHLNFCRGNAVKYIARAGLKDPNKELEDLEKAAFYLNREIARMKGAAK